MTERAFPVVYATRVTVTAEFYERLGFTRHFQMPPDGEPGFVALRRGVAEVAVVSNEWPQDEYGATVGTGVRFEMFVYVEDVDAAVKQLRERQVTILREAADMPGGERVVRRGPRWQPGRACSPGQPRRAAMIPAALSG